MKAILSLSLIILGAQSYGSELDLIPAHGMNCKSGNLTMFIYPRLDGDISENSKGITLDLRNADDQIIDDNNYTLSSSEGGKLVFEDSSSEIRIEIKGLKQDNLHGAKVKYKNGLLELQRTFKNCDVN